MPATLRKKRTTVAIREDGFPGSAPASVDADQAVIKGVKILGEESGNGRRYTLQARKKAIPLYEGRKVNVDHPAKPHDLRKCKDRFGKICNVEERGDGLYGDLVLLRSHEMATTVLEAAQKMPDAYALSHNVDARGYTDEAGIFVVEEIVEVRSVDLVADGGTNKSLFEGNMAKRKKETVTLKSLIEGSGIALKLKKSLLEDAPEDVMSMEMEPEAVEPSGDDDGWKQDLVAAIGKLVSSDSDDDHAMAKKIMGILKPESASTPTPTPEGEGDEPEKKDDDVKDDDKKPTEEGKGKQTPAPGAVTLTEAKAKQLAKLAGVTEDKQLLETLTALPEDKAIAHLDYVKGLQAKAKGAGSPRSSSPAQPVTEGQSKPASNAKSFAEAILA